jgi:site-specific DNA recombinase
MRVAAYARYSTDQQREASLEDQLRNCRRYCEREGWPEPVIYTDAAVSGARSDRPGYRMLLSEAAQFDVILVDDLSRLSRDSAEVAIAARRIKFAGARLIGVSDGVDTARKSHKADLGLRGLMSELYLDDLADKTHRGLTGRALQGASAGGLPYGYRVTGTGQRAIDPDQAAVVRRIFADYLAGQSPRDIAAALNADGVPSPRGSTWVNTAIHGDVRRGIGILANPIYVGRQVWNRSNWIKHPETGRRVRQERPPSEWIITEQPELAIVDATTWDAAQRRLNARKAPPDQRSPGRSSSQLLSGILRCETCGGPVTFVDRYRYGCTRAKASGYTACDSRTYVRKDQADPAMIDYLLGYFRDGEALRRLKTAVTAELKRLAPDATLARAKLSAAERVRDNIAAALRAGIITATTRAELERAEADINAARAELEVVRKWQPTQIVPRLEERWRNAVATLTRHDRDRHAARELLKEIAPDGMILRNENGNLFAEIAASGSQIKMVAGAGFEPATFGL